MELIDISKKFTHINHSKRSEYINIKDLYNLLMHFVYVFLVILIINNDYFLKAH
jgi:hypothetical protein